MRAGFKFKPDELVELLKHEMEAKHMELAGRYDAPIPTDKIRAWKLYLQTVIERYPPGYDNHVKILKQIIEENT